MRLAGSGAADQDQVALCIEEGAGSNLTDMAFIYRRVAEDESVEILQHRELRTAEAIVDRTRLAMGDLGADQAGEQRVKFLAPVEAFTGHLVEAGAHAVELEAGHGLNDLVTFHQAVSFRFRSLS